jgi:large repetitive protein
MAQTPRLRLLVCCLVVLLGWLAGQERAAAQVTLNRYSPAPWNYDGFSLSRPNRAGHLRFGAQLQLDYAREPLVWLRDVNDPDAGNYEVVSDQLVLHPIVSLGLFDRVLLFMKMPLNASVRQGKDLPQDLMDQYHDFATIGALMLGARVNLLGDNESLAALGVQGSLGLPLGKWFGGASTSFVSETTVTGLLAVLFEVRPTDRIRLGASAGILFRRETSNYNLNLDDELKLVVGAGMLVHDSASSKVEVILELFGNTILQEPFTSEETPFEALLGVKAHFIEGWSGGLGADLGMSGGYGSPNFRLLAMLGWTMPDKPRIVDQDNDGILDEVDRCPVIPEDHLAPDPQDGCPLADQDNDGILDANDKCPKEAEDKDGFEDDDGCPDPDNDNDGVLDASDKCPTEAEDKDGFQDDDGCPDPDNDADGVLDANDKCPTEAEDKDGFQDDDGCPDPDNDGDGILDANDKCPTEAEPKNGVDDDDGCPDLVRFAGTQIMTLKPIHFETGSAVIHSDSEAILQELAAVITGHPEIIQLSIDGHTDNKGNPAKNLKLSQDRAESVRTFLVGLGIAGERLVAHGYGDQQPIADNNNADGRTRNRRVEFNIMSTAQ